MLEREEASQGRGRAQRGKGEPGPPPPPALSLPPAHLKRRRPALPLVVVSSGKSSRGGCPPWEV